MKKHGDHTRIRKGGILHWSTLCLLASSSVGLISCDSETTYTATAEDAKMAKLQQSLDAFESRKSQLMNGLVEHNFELEGLGFYHAEAKDFFPYRYGQEKDGKWFANGEWLDTEPARCAVSVSHPSAEALSKVEELLEREQALATESNGQSSESNPSATHHHHNHGMGGMGTMLMMYWMLSGNRSGYMPGAGFRNAQANQQGWQQNVNQQRQMVNAHAAANPAYNRLVQQSKASGAPVTQGSSVRGGFGTSNRDRSTWGS